MTYTGRQIQLGRRLRGPESQYALRPYGIAITATNPEADEITFVGPRGGRTIPITHPYLGPNSWIRVMPERTTRAILDSRSDSGESFIAAYHAEQASVPRLNATYRDSRFYYRRLREGEIAIASPGIAEQHFASGGSLSHRAGPLTHIMNVERLEINAKAPTIIHRTLDNDVTDISSETRFGVVKRTSDTDRTQDIYVKITPDGGTDEVFAKEYLRNVSSKGPPYTLVDHREGHVIENDQSEPTSSVTGKKLRSRTKFGTSRLEEATLEVDVEGNMNVSLPDNASYGVNLNVNRTDLKVILGRDEQHNVGRNLLYDVSQTALITADTKIALACDNTILGDRDTGSPIMIATGTTRLGAVGFATQLQTDTSTFNSGITASLAAITSSAAGVPSSTATVAQLQAVAAAVVAAFTPVISFVNGLPTAASNAATSNTKAI